MILQMHIAFYLEHCDLPHGHMQGWVILGVAAKLSYSVSVSNDLFSTSLRF